MADNKVDYVAIAKRLNEIKPIYDEQIYDANWCRERVERFSNVCRIVGAEFMSPENMKPADVQSFLEALVNREIRQEFKKKFRQPLISRWAMENLHRRYGGKN